MMQLFSQLVQQKESALEYRVKIYPDLSQLLHLYLGITRTQISQMKKLICHATQQLSLALEMLPWM